MEKKNCETTTIPTLLVNCFKSTIKYSKHLPFSQRACLGASARSTDDNFEPFFFVFRLEFKMSLATGAEPKRRKKILVIIVILIRLHNLYRHVAAAIGGAHGVEKD